jgi:ABC-type transporter Mla subunit MlaD
MSDTLKALRDDIQQFLGNGGVRLQDLERWTRILDTLLAAEDAQEPKPLDTTSSPC